MCRLKEKLTAWWFGELADECHVVNFDHHNNLIHLLCISAHVTKRMAYFTAVLNVRKSPIQIRLHLSINNCQTINELNGMVNKSTFFFLPQKLTQNCKTRSTDTIKLKYLNNCKELILDDHSLHIKPTPHQLYCCGISRIRDQSPYLSHSGSVGR